MGIASTVKSVNTNYQKAHIMCDLRMRSREPSCLRELVQLVQEGLYQEGRSLVSIQHRGSGVYARV